MDFSILSPKEKKKIMEKKVNELHRLGYTYSQISRLVKTSKTTVCYVLKGRKDSRKKP